MFFSCKNCQRQSCKAPNYPCKNDSWGTTPSTGNFGSNWPRCSEIADFRSIFARIASAITPSEKKLQLTPIGSPLRAFQWAQDEHRTLSPPKRWLKNAVSKILTISCDISETVRDRMSVTINLEICIRAFDWYRPRWPWMTLNGVIALIWRFFADFDFFAGQIRRSGWI